jgi:hypothetical protein
VSPESYLRTDASLLLRRSTLYRKFWLEKKRQTLLAEQWRDELRRWNSLPDRIKIGFGPVVTGETTLGVRKWHIEPVINYINRNNARYACDVFFKGEDLTRFHLVVVVRDFDFFTPRSIYRLKSKGTRLIYKITDNPAACRRSYLTDTDFIPKVDGIIAANPLQADDVRHHMCPVTRICAPILSSVHKGNYTAQGPVRILWQGHAQNVAFQEFIKPFLRSVETSTGRAIRLIYHTRLSSGYSIDEKTEEYIPWTIENAFTILAECDIAISAKPSEDPIQQRKPATKIMTYMAGGLPVVCTPSSADREMIDHGQTGFFAESEEEWIQYLSLLVADENLRAEIGCAAREAVVERCNIERVAQAHVAFFDEVLRHASN